MKIMPELFEAFLKCPTKCWLRATSEMPSGNAYAEWGQSQEQSYRGQETARLTAELSNGDLATSPEVENLKSAKWRLAVNIVAQASSPAGFGSVPLPEGTPGGTPGQLADETSALQSLLHAVERIPSAGRGQPAQFVPIRFIYRNKLTKDDKLLLAFDAFALSEMLGRAVNLGKIIHGDDHATLKVKTPALAGEVRKRLGKIAALLASSAPPDLVLNRHCAECEFQARCRKLAVEKDDLSLLAGMSAKERQKLRSKGIFTVTQLSYTFRPRRRPKRQRDKREKYHHALKALAIREQKIHIVGSPELKLEGTPDCVALESVSTALALSVQKPEIFSDADFVDVPKTPSTERGKELYQCLNSVLKSAQLIYANKKISLQPVGNQNLNESVNESPKKASHLRRLPSHGGRIIRVVRKRKCPYHRDHPSFLQESKREAEHALLDIAYTKRGCKKVLVRYIGRKALCPHCHARHSPLAIQRLRGQIFGMGFHVLAVYLRVALRLSFNLVSKVIRDLLHADIPPQTIFGFVEQTFKDQRQTEEALLRAILKSVSIHVDETKMNILGVQQYVWVMTDGSHVVFYLTPGRDTDFLHELLAQYNGTIVSDFYGGYDSLPCRQQKCLVHLIRDLNDDLWKNPFDEEYEQFVLAVRDLIVPMIEDIQRYGLKCLHLKKHRRRVERFYDRTITACESTKELILKYKKRFERYRDSMFTFLTHDGVSWNNNAAERAIRHLAVQRKISGAFTTRGANHYLRLLAIAQTCRFQDKSFLGFLLSGLQNVDAYKEAQRGRRR